MAEVMRENFQPKRRGRLPLVDIADLVEVIHANPGLWVTEDYPEKEAASVVRRLKMYSQFEVATVKKSDDVRSVYARAIA